MDELLAWLEEDGHTQKALGEAMLPPVTQGAISQWIANDEIPLKRVREIERITGISAATLRPDHFGEAA